MASVPAAVAMRRAVRGLALLLAPLLAGCVSLPQGSWGGPAAPKVCQIVNAWQNNIGYGPDPNHGGKQQPILAGRMYLFGPDFAHPQPAQGGFSVEMFDESNPDPNAEPLERWIFNPSDMPGLAKKDYFGLGYTVLLPSKRYHDGLMKVRMRTCYRPTTGAPLYKDDVLTLDSGNRLHSTMTSEPLAFGPGLPPVQGAGR